MLPVIPWKLVGVGVLVLTILGAMIGLIRYGQALGECKANNEALELELLGLTTWQKSAIETMRTQGESIATWMETSNDFEAEYLAAIAVPPERVIRWRERIREVPVAVPLGDCDRAATNAWDVLLEAGLIGERTWEDTSRWQPPSPSFYRDAARLRRELQPQPLSLYLSPSLSHRPNEFVGTYQLSPSQIYSDRP